MASDLETMLRSEKFECHLNDAFSQLQAFADDPLLRSFEDPHMRRATYRWFLRNGSTLRETTEELMASRLPMPVRCTASDIVRSAIEHGLSQDYQAQGPFTAQLIASVLASAAIPRVSPSFLVSQEVACEEDSLPRPFWTSDSGLALTLAGGSSSGYDPDESDILRGFSIVGEIELPAEQKAGMLEARAPIRGSPAVFAQIDGSCTPNALQEAKERIQPALRSILHTSAITKRLPLAQRLGFSFQDHRLQYRLAANFSFPIADEGRAQLTHLGMQSDAHSSQWSTSSIVLIVRCLDLYFLSPTRKDSLELRLRNALHLLIEADNQDKVSVTLALSCAAIEAMVCSKTANVVDEFSRNVATLLESNANQRVVAIKAIKKLYDLRSKVLHGSKLEIALDLERRTRLLAAGVLLAILEWQACAKRLGDEGKTVPEFFKELEDAKVSGKQMVGVPDDASAWLPTEDVKG